MAKKDKEFGEWKSTLLVPNKISIKRFEFGITVKEKGSDITLRNRFPDGTTSSDATDILEEYYVICKKELESKES